MTEAQNIYFNSIYSKFPEIIEGSKGAEDLKQERDLLAALLNTGEKLGFNVEKYYIKINKLFDPIKQ